MPLLFFLVTLTMTFWHFADYTIIIVVTSVLGAVALIGLIILFQFIR